MKCKMCKKETGNNKSVCDKCKGKLKKKASESEVEEFEKLIEAKDLETTKDLTNLKDLINSDIDDDFIDMKDSKLVILFYVLFGLIIVGLIVFLVFWFINKPKDIESDNKPATDYEEIINEYGVLVTSEATKYIEENKEIPTWQTLSDLVKYDKYEISCGVHNIYIDGSVYLDHCKVNNKTVKYTYGTFQEDAKTAKEITIYKKDDEYNVDSGDEVAKFTCNTLNCEYVKAFDKYVVVKEKDANYLYNYNNNAVEFGPYQDGVLLAYNNTLYGIYYDSNIYNISLGKTIKNIKGKTDFEKDYIDTGIQYKYGYMITYTNGYNFVNLKSGNISFSIRDNIKSFIEDMKSGILYILVGDINSNKFKIYNSNGKLMFNGGEFIDFRIKNNNLITFTSNNFKVYDNKLNLKQTSKNYTNILRIYDEFIILIDNKKLKLVDYNDKVIATFTKEWKDDYKPFDMSYIYNDSEKVLHITFLDSSAEDTKYVHYNYNFTTKEIEELDNTEVE